MRSLWTFLFVVLLFAPGVYAQGIITTVAGNGTAGFSGDGNPATSASLAGPFGVAVDSGGNFYIADQQNHRVRKVDTTGVITTVAGTGVSGFNGDGIPATSARLNRPSGVAVDSAGNLYILDRDNFRIRRVDTAGIITTVAGGGSSLGDMVPATSVMLGQPFGAAFDSAGNFYIADTETHRVRKVVPGADDEFTGASDEIITTVAGIPPSPLGGGFGGDGGPATSARLNRPFAVAFDSAGNLYIADFDNNRIRKVVPGTDGQFTGASDEIITTVAGTGLRGFGGDGGPATSASLNNPSGVAVDSIDNFYIADGQNHRIRFVVFALAVEIDIKPGRETNTINPAGGGHIDVAILTTERFDARTVSPITVEFGPAGASMSPGSPHLRDVDRDGDLDLLLRFRIRETGIQCGDTEASLTGETFEGQPIQGSDRVVTVGCEF